MNSSNRVGIADRVSRKRAIIAATAAFAFLAVHGLLRPFFYAQGRASTDLWAINALVLLACFATGGGLLNSRQLRALVNDEVARVHYRVATAVGYWIAMIAAMALYVVPSFRSLTGREAAFLIVTPSVALALLAFSYLEMRAHRGA